MMDPPSTPTTYMPAGDLPKSGEEEVKYAGPPPESVKLNFRLPHEAVFADEEVNMVLVPAETGDFGILPGHVPVVAKLRPGVVSVENKENVTSKVRRVSSIFERSIDRKTKDLFLRARERTNASFRWHFSTHSCSRRHRWYLTFCTTLFSFASHEQYFVSSGFAFAHADSSVDILAVEAVPVEHLDETVVRKMLSEHTAKFQAAKDDYEKATAQIGIDVSTAMVSAIETMGK